MGRERPGFLVALACAIAVVACDSTPPAAPARSPAAPRYRLTGLIRASCYEAPPTVAQGFCSLHAQIQNEGGPGSGGIAELILTYRPKDSDSEVSAACDSVFPALDTKDVAEVDCYVLGDPPIYSTRVVSTDIAFLPLPSPQPASGTRPGHVQRP